MSPIVPALALLGFAASLASAQVTIQPSAPVAFEAVHVTAPLSAVGQYWPNGTQVRMEGNRITVSVERIYWTLPPPIPDLSVLVGNLPVGAYEVVVVRRGLNEPEDTLGTARFAVGPKPERPGPAPTVDYTDHWWNPGESGWGIVITQHTNDALFAAWFVYGADNKPIWYVIPSGEWTNSFTYTGTIYKTTGPGLGVPFDPGQVTRTPVGNGTLSFWALNKATFTYTVDGLSGTKSLERFAF